VAGPSRVYLARTCGLVLLAGVVGCSPVQTPAQAVHKQPESVLAAEPLATLPDGAYLASLTVLDLNTDFGVAVAIEPQAATFLAGDLNFVVINKWLGLRQGAHHEVVQVVDPDGRTVLHTEEADFTVTADTFVVTVAEPFAIPGAGPGVYLVTVRLDGALLARYPFRVVQESVP